MNSLKAFAFHINTTISWPLSKSFVRSYVNWALSVKKLRPESVKVYISDIKLAHRLRDKKIEFDNDFFINSMLKGAKNMSLYSNKYKSKKFVMTFPLLKLLGHEIASSNWDPASKLVFWAACCTAFFGSFRLGEILPKSEKTEPETLTWDRVRFTQKNSIVINIKFPKVIRDHAGDFVDIFEIKNCSMCPFSALKNLAESNPIGVSKNLPVFRFKNGKNLTVSNFTRTMISLLEKHIGPQAQYFSGHSFRAGIPSALAECPNLASDYDIMVWGRWSSDTYKSYTRLKHNARLAIFNKIISMFKL